MAPQARGMRKRHAQKSPLESGLRASRCKPVRLAARAY
ncbi:hypothetical protein BURCENBC7_AP6055 [Burkholderia cenocepacia BC7]|nr:uncharacterized protein BCN122_I0960 [Burkholderia cenocepacia]EPZ85772.1 hypothetical protein BURCENK562V_C6151 [Burkholderia cenocepacia K56-2Valvano]ERI25347.1 hypothetical protein BURCENBC7_AP6055 [Burkholderia cenocepacia BC7]